MEREDRVISILPRRGRGTAGASSHPLSGTHPFQTSLEIHLQARITALHQHVPKISSKAIAPSPRTPSPPISPDVPSTVLKPSTTHQTTQQVREYVDEDEDEDEVEDDNDPRPPAVDLAAAIAIAIAIKAVVAALRPSSFPLSAPPRLRGKPSAVGWAVPTTHPQRTRRRSFENKSAAKTPPFSRAHPSICHSQP